MNHFFPDLKISDAHGTLIKASLNDFPVHNFLPLYHPAAALYNGGLRDELIKILKKFLGF
jgi:uracil-DNA glycosylase